jgi:hypothetical protein
MNRIGIGRTARRLCRTILVVGCTLWVAHGCDSETTSSTGAAAPGGGGEGGIGATGGTAGEGATGGSGGGDQILSVEVEACLFVNACEADGGDPVGMQLCLAHFYDRQWRWASFGAYRLEMEAMECRLRATDCDGVRACDSEPHDYDDACAATPGETLCVEDTWVTCDFDGNATAAFDCSASGQSCNVDIWAGCGSEPCLFGSMENECDEADPTKLRICAPSGFIETVDCARENNFVLVHQTGGDEATTIAGEVCGEDPMLGQMGCIGQGEPCDFFSQACEGDTLVSCAGGFLGHRDCAALEPAGQSCGYVTDGPFAGGAACGVVESACDPTAPETCTDGAVTYCAQGKVQMIRCAEAGYADCGMARAGEHTIAYCMP